MQTDPPIKDFSALKDLFPEMKDYTLDPADEQVKDERPNDLSPSEKSQRKVYVSRDKKQRGGKQVTLIEGIDAPDEIMHALLSKLKSMCSAGGACKGGELIIQGDHVKKVIAWLIKDGYKLTKQKGG